MAKLRQGKSNKNNVGSGGGVPTLTRLAEGCAIADTCGAETKLATWPMLSVAPVTGEAEVASRELFAPAVSNYVISIWMHGQTKTELKPGRREDTFRNHLSEFRIDPAHVHRKEIHLSTATRAGMKNCRKGSKMSGRSSRRCSKEHPEQLRSCRCDSAN